MDARTLAWIDQQRAQQVDTIRRYGWAIQYVGGDACGAPGCPGEESDLAPFAYTIGLFGLGHPELLIVGVDVDTARTVLNAVGNRIVEGADLVPGELIELEEWPRPIVPEVVPNAGEVLLGANGFYDRPPEFSVPALQLTYADEAGAFPWDDGYAESDRQPRPGTFAA